MKSDRFSFSFFLILILSLTFNSSYAIVELQDVELNCPIDSFDFNDMYVEFDYIQMCEVVGTILNLNADSVFVDDLLAYPPPQEIISTVSVKEQFNQLFALKKSEFEDKIKKLLFENASLTGKIQDMELLLKKLIELIQLKIIELSNGYDASKEINLDEVISQEELEKIIREAFPTQFILPAYGQTVDNTFDLKSKLDELASYSKQVYDLEIKNKNLVKRLEKLSVLKSNLDDEFDTINKVADIINQNLKDRIQKLPEDVTKASEKALEELEKLYKGWFK